MLGKDFFIAEDRAAGLQDKRLLVRMDEELEDYVQTGSFRDNETGKVVVEDAMSLLARTPVGSRVMWRNFDPEVDDDEPFKNENALKIGDDSYFAHPMGFVTEGKLVCDLAGYGPGMDKATSQLRRMYAIKWIALVEIEEYTDLD